MGKLLELSELVELATELHKQKKKIVLTCGCFDILHIGHIRYLKESRQLGDFLIVGLNSDESIRQLKGNSRPIIPQEERAEILCELGSVDAVFIFNELVSDNLVLAVLPDVFTKGGDRTEVLEKELVEELGGMVKIIPYVNDHSTTELIRKIEKL
jgi:rfaE bifunctional protein nucleotidyltransferase chain/domain